MSYYFQSASAHSMSGVPPVVGVPFTVSLWIYPFSATTNQYIFMLGDNAGTTNFFTILLSASTNVVTARVQAGGTTGSATSTVFAKSGRWFHLCATFNSATSRSIYVNGTNKVTNTTSATPTGINFASIGRAMLSSPSGSYTGLIAECTLWNMILAEAEIVALGKGGRSTNIQPQAILAYWPLDGSSATISPDFNVRQQRAYDMSITGATSNQNHPVFTDNFIYPQRRRVITGPSPAILANKSTSLLWNVYTNAFVTQDLVEAAYKAGATSKALITQDSIEALYKTASLSFITQDVVEVLMSSQTIVNKSEQLVWNAMAVTPKTEQLVWNTAALVNKERVTLWNQSSLVNQQQSLLWDILAGVTASQEVSLLWNTYKLAAKTEGLLWNVSAPISRERGILYNVYQSVYNQNQLIYNVGLTVTNSRQAVWDIHSSLLKDIALLWDVRKSIGITSQLIWNQLKAISASKTMVWNTLQGVTIDRGLLWNVTTLVNFARTLKWDDRAIASIQRGILWDVRQPITKVILLDGFITLYKDMIAYVDFSKDIQCNITLLTEYDLYLKRVHTVLSYITESKECN